jgi:hypothetical protein
MGVEISPKPYRQATLKAVSSIYLNSLFSWGIASWVPRTGCNLELFDVMDIPTVFCVYYI